VEQGQDLLLQRLAEVDQQVAAGQDVEPGEGRVGDEVLRREDHHLAELPVDPVAVFLGNEVAGQPLRREVGGDVGGVAGLAGLVDGVHVEIGGVDLQRELASGGRSRASRKTMASE
jgi:hypothetical protein